MASLDYSQLIGFGQPAFTPAPFDPMPEIGAADPMFPGQQVSTTMPGTAMFSRRPTAPLQRRIDVSRAVEELEFLLGNRQVSNRVLAQKAFQARKQLMGSVRWSDAYGATQRGSYDTHGDLMRRVDAVWAELERRLGFRLTPKTAAALL